VRRREPKGSRILSRHDPAVTRGKVRDGEEKEYVRVRIDGDRDGV
jgi:hypothetical protein